MQWFSHHLFMKVFGVRRLSKAAVYILSVILAFIIIFLSEKLALLFHGKNFLILFMVPIFISALLGGFGPGMAVTAIVALYTDFLLSPPGSFLISDPNNLFQWAVLIFNGVLFSLLFEFLSRSHLQELAGKEQLSAAKKSLEKITAELKAAQHLAGIGNWLWDIRAGTHTWSEEIFLIYGRDPDLPAASYPEVQQYFTPESWARLSASVETSLATGAGFECDAEVVRPDGTHRWVTSRGNAVRDTNGAVRCLHGTVQDITERRQAEEIQRIAATAFASREAMVITDSSVIVLQVNAAFSELTGYAPEEIIGLTPAILHSDHHDQKFYAAMWESIHSTGMWEGEIWDRHKNGQIFLCWTTISAVRDRFGKVTHYVSTQTDITERKAAEEEISRLAFFDVLTGLPNRRLLMERFRQTLANCNRTGCNGALLFIDLDNFKNLNDSFGHDKGDLMLQNVAERLSECIREGDTVARFGGDEFMVMLDGLSHDSMEASFQAESAGRKILEALEQPYDLGGLPYRTTASIGITLFFDHHCNVQDLVKRADIALYQAKAAGRNTLRFYDEKIQALVTAHLELDAELRQGLQMKEFVLHFQAQVDRQGNLTGVEALVRWLHPHRGILGPTEFIHLAEETGLIIPLGTWVLESACRQLAAWATIASLSHLTIAVNVSAIQICSSDFVQQVIKVLDDTGADPHKLKLEITESVLLEDMEKIVAKMKALQALGVGFSLDDFGTGYSSLAYLGRLPLDQLKIDQSFVIDMLVDQNNATIASAIVALGQNLGLAVIAEGVETEEQRTFLANRHCNAYQGYLFSQPLNLEQFERWACNTA